jgi:hypothetical protein
LESVLIELDEARGANREEGYLGEGYEIPTR